MHPSKNAPTKNAPVQKCTYKKCTSAKRYLQKLSIEGLADVQFLSVIHQIDLRPGCVREHNVDGGVLLHRSRCVPNPVVVCVAGDDPCGARRALKTRRSSWVDGESADGSGGYAYLRLSEDGADVVG